MMILDQRLQAKNLHNYVFILMLINIVYTMPISTPPILIKLCFALKKLITMLRCKLNSVRTYNQSDSDHLRVQLLSYPKILTLVGFKKSLRASL